MHETHTIRGYKKINIQYYLQSQSMSNHSKQTKKQSINIQEDDNTLLPGLPNDLASICLVSLPTTLLFSVCRAWRRLLYSSSFPRPPFYSLYASLSPLPYPTNNSMSNSVQFHSFDPFSYKWQTLPLPSINPPLHLLHHHPSFISRNFPVQSLTVANHLVLIAGETHHLVPALTRPLLFHPESNRWLFGPKFTVPRRWCVTGAFNNTVYLASGVGLNFDGDVARSMEKWDMNGDKENWKWEKMAELRDGRFSREAVEAVGYKGKICMVNVKGNAPKDGWVYDVEKMTWENMPIGMIAGWTGAAAATVDGEELMYVVDETTGRLSEYDGEKDIWKMVTELAELKGAEQMSVRRGRVCVVCANGEKIMVIDVVAIPARFWVVEPPSGLKVVGLHILPRICKD
ncbi:F-box/kelch-repeat protein SKIP25-like [Mercurialis annua]|uniref:F-box/kelch-repeat protein SKIP25-like n=1 Tax=Mercurialis annua TaxID=3986 RepID=UPI0021603BB4|nr:F-box/kelch-repeat protein SKIP25-like [Mercurialis annua]